MPINVGDYFRRKNRERWYIMISLLYLCTQIVLDESPPFKRRLAAYYYHENGKNHLGGLSLGVVQEERQSKSEDDSDGFRISFFRDGRLVIQNNLKRVLNKSKPKTICAQYNITMMNTVILLYEKERSAKKSVFAAGFVKRG